MEGIIDWDICIHGLAVKGSDAVIFMYGLVGVGIIYYVYSLDRVENRVFNIGVVNVFENIEGPLVKRFSNCVCCVNDRAEFDGIFMRPVRIEGRKRWSVLVRLILIECSACKCRGLIIGVHILVSWSILIRGPCCIFSVWCDVFCGCVVVCCICVFCVSVCC